jgi:hypothetical protein
MFDHRGYVLTEKAYAELREREVPIDYVLTDKAHKALKEEPVDENQKAEAWASLKAGRKVS